MSPETGEVSHTSRCEKTGNPLAEPRTALTKQVQEQGAGFILSLRPTTQPGTREAPVVQAVLQADLVASHRMRMTVVTRAKVWVYAVW